MFMLHGTTSWTHVVSANDAFLKYEYSKCYLFSVKKRSVSTEKLEQETSGLHKQTTVSSAGLQNSVAKSE